MNSIWLNNKTSLNAIKELEDNITTDVCIIGAGIFGLTCGYYLSKNGINVVILEKESEIASKTTGHTTAKITSQHNLIYKYLIDSVGIDQAKQYLFANQEAIENIYQIIKDENINCDFERQDSYVYTKDKSEIEKIKLENEAVNLLGFNSEFVPSTSLPFDVLGAIKFSNQAQFNPIKYCSGLANTIIKNSGEIYTNTLVQNIEKEDNNFITTTPTHKVKSKYVILASHYPFIDRLGYYFLKMYQSTSYVIAVDIGNKVFNGMYINSEQPTFSYRFADCDGKKLLLVGGADYKTGSKIDLSNAYRILEDEIRKYYPDCKVLYRWNTEDCISLDKIPYIGEFSHFMPGMYIGTGFNKWGMTSSNIAANIITNKILNHDNKYEDVFVSTRLHPIKNNAELGNMIKETANSLVINKFKVPEKNHDDKNDDNTHVENAFADIENDTGHVFEYNGEKVGIYKDKDGKISAIKPICTHLGCLLSWNNIDKTWDCPCHGSRFDYLGHQLYNPAIKDLDVVELDL